MTELVAAPTDLIDLMSGRVSIIVSAQLQELEWLVMQEVDVWFATVDHAKTRLSRKVGDDFESTTTLKLPPTGVIGLIEHKEGEFDRLYHWWHDTTGLSVPRVVAGNSSAAALMVIHCLSTELVASNKRAVSLERSLIETRTDYEEMRILVASLSKTLGHRPQSEPVLQLATEPSKDGLAPSKTHVRFNVWQRLGCSLEGIAAIAVHLHAILPDQSESMRVRIIGEESRRIFASWTVPFNKLAPGWLALDLPTPVGPERETALLEVSTDASTPTAFALSLERNWVPEGAACWGEGLFVEGRALALRLWTAPIGGQFLLAPFWDWDQAGSTLPLEGVLQLISHHEWMLAHVLDGDFNRAEMGSEREQFVARAPAAGCTALLLPKVTLGGTNMLYFRCNVQSGNPKTIRLAAWTLDCESAVQSMNDLTNMKSTSRFSGWRPFDNLGAGSINMLVPLSIGAEVQVVLMIQNDDPDHDAVVEHWELGFMSTENPATLREKQIEAGRLRLPSGKAVDASVRRELRASYDAVDLLEHFVSSSDYEHFELVIWQLAVEAELWPQIRFKLALIDHDPMIEFRIMEGWPIMFLAWPGIVVDEYGPVSKARIQEIEMFVSSLSNARDRLMIAGLSQVLINAVSEGVEMARLSDAAGAIWVDAARKLVERMSTTLQTTKP